MAPKAKPPSATCPKCGDNVWVGPCYQPATLRELDTLKWECSTCRYIDLSAPLDNKETP